MSFTPPTGTASKTGQGRRKPDQLVIWALITGTLPLLGIAWFLLASSLPLPLGIAGVIFQQLTMPSGVIGLVLGILAFRRTRHADSRNRRLGIAALALGVLGFLAVATFYGVAISGFASNG